MNTLSLRGVGWARSLVTTTVFLAACGGDALVLAIVVTPLNGAWVQPESKERLSFLPDDDKERLFSANYPVNAVIDEPVNACDGEVDEDRLFVTGTYDNGKVTLYANKNSKSACIEGTFTTMVRLEAVATSGRPVRAYVNDRVGVQLQAGVWVSEGGGARLKFSQLDGIGNDEGPVEVRVCDVSPGAQPVTLQGDLFGYNVRDNVGPKIENLTAPGESTARYSNVVYTGGATITLQNRAGQTVKLRRQREVSETTCP